MRRPAFAALLAALGACALAAPGAVAATRTVDVGGHGFKGAPRNLQALAFVRDLTTVHVGDTVRFRILGGLIHTVTFVPDGQAAPALARPDPAHPVSGVSDAAGAPFWFDGQPQTVIDPRVSARVGAGSVTGRRYLNSGIPASEAKGETYSLRFPKAGRFDFLCLVHPGMQGIVKVVRRSARVPTAAQDAAAKRREIARIVRQASAAAKRPVPAGTVDVGRTGSRFTINAMLPSTTTVTAGQSVTFTMAGQSALEIHTVTLGPEAVTSAVQKALDAPVPGTGTPPTIGFDPLASFPSDPPPALPAYTGANHGNGYLNSGFLDANPRSPPPVSTTVTFATAGTYHFECTVHANMHGTVVVRPG
jgi:plastocyanin